MITGQPPDSSKRYKQIIILTIVLAICNIALHLLVIKSGGYGLDGKYVPYSPQENIKVSLTTFLFGLPLISLIVGAIVAVIPYKGLPYSKRRNRAWLILLLSFNCIFFIGHIVKAIILII
jgi:hypothetical protein